MISMAQLILVLEELIVNTALPHIQRAASWMAGLLARRCAVGFLFTRSGGAG
jgi:hypothetical protein